MSKSFRFQYDTRNFLIIKQRNNKQLSDIRANLPKASYTKPYQQFIIIILLFLIIFA